MGVVKWPRHFTSRCFPLVPRFPTQLLRILRIIFQECFYYPENTAKWETYGIRGALSNPKNGVLQEKSQVQLKEDLDSGWNLCIKPWGRVKMRQSLHQFSMRNSSPQEKYHHCESADIQVFKPSTSPIDLSTCQWSKPQGCRNRQVNPNNTEAQKLLQQAVARGDLLNPPEIKHDNGKMDRRNRWFS